MEIVGAMEIIPLTDSAENAPPSVPTGVISSNEGQEECGLPSHTIKKDRRKEDPIDEVLSVLDDFENFMAGTAVSPIHNSSGEVKSEMDSTTTTTDTKSPLGGDQTSYSSIPPSPCNNNNNEDPQSSNIQRRTASFRDADQSTSTLTPPFTNHKSSDRADDSKDQSDEMPNENLSKRDQLSTTTTPPSLSSSSSSDHNNYSVINCPPNCDNIKNPPDYDNIQNPTDCGNIENPPDNCDTIKSSPHDDDIKPGSYNLISSQAQLMHITTANGVITTSNNSSSLLGSSDRSVDGTDDASDEGYISIIKSEKSWLQTNDEVPTTKLESNEVGSIQDKSQPNNSNEVPKRESNPLLLNHSHPLQSKTAVGSAEDEHQVGSVIKARRNRHPYRKSDSLKRKKTKRKVILSKSFPPNQTEHGKLHESSAWNPQSLPPGVFNPFLPLPPRKFYCPIKKSPVPFLSLCSNSNIMNPQQQSLQFPSTTVGVGDFSNGYSNNDYADNNQLSSTDITRSYYSDGLNNGAVQQAASISTDPPIHSSSTAGHHRQHQGGSSEISSSRMNHVNSTLGTVETESSSSFSRSSTSSSSSINDDSDTSSSPVIDRAENSNSSFSSLRSSSLPKPPQCFVANMVAPIEINNDDSICSVDDGFVYDMKIDDDRDDDDVILIDDDEEEEILDNDLVAIQSATINNDVTNKRESKGNDDDDDDDDIIIEQEVQSEIIVEANYSKKDILDSVRTYVTASLPELPAEEVSALIDKAYVKLKKRGTTKAITICAIEMGLNSTALTEDSTYVEDVTEMVKYERKQVMAQQISEMFPDVEGDWISSQILQNGLTGEQTADWIISSPKTNVRVYESKDGSASTSSQLQPPKTVKIDNYFTASFTRSDAYQKYALELLLQKFPNIRKPCIRLAFQAHNSQYAKSWKAIHGALTDPFCKIPDGYMLPTSGTHFSTYRSRRRVRLRLLKSKRKYRQLVGEPPEEIQEELRYIRAQLGAEYVDYTPDELKHCGTVECEICYDEVPAPEVAYCPADHGFCKICLRRHVEESVFGSTAITINCPDPDCKESYGLESLKDFIELKVIERLDEKISVAAIQNGVDGEIERCKRCQWAAILDEPKEVNKVFRCLECGLESCRVCGNDWDEVHFGTPCDQMETDAEAAKRKRLEEKLTSITIRRCHRCKTAFQKQAGCNKMTCSCGATSCYVCSAPNIAYSHFCQHPFDDNKRCSVNCGKQCTLYVNVEEKDKSRLEEVLKEEEAAKPNSTKDNQENLPAIQPLHTALLTNHLLRDLPQINLLEAAAAVGLGKLYGEI